MSMRRAILAAATAAIAAGLVLTAGCGPDGSPSGGTAPSADGKGPITFAVGSDDAGFFKTLIEPWNAAPNEEARRCGSLCWRCSRRNQRMATS